MNAYLGVDITPLPDGKEFTLYQPFLIDQIIQALGFDKNTTKGATKNTPAGYPLLNKDENGPSRKASEKYRDLSVCLGIFKEQHVLTLQCQPINAQYLTMIHTFNMNDQSSILTGTYWILETRE